MEAVAVFVDGPAEERGEDDGEDGVQAAEVGGGLFRVAFHVDEVGGRTVEAAIGAALKNLSHGEHPKDPGEVEQG